MTLSDDDLMRAKFNRIEEAVDQAEALTRMVLHTARPSESGPVPVPLHPLVKECLKRVESELPDNVKIHRQIATDAAAVAVDPVQFFKIVMTVLSAAASALKQEGCRLSVSFGQADVESRADRGNQLLPTGPVVVLAVEYACRENGPEDHGSRADQGGTKPFRLSEIEGSPPAIDTIVDNIGGVVTCRPIDGGRRLEVMLPITAPRAVR
jgi:nitrogen-specific signal transduction histidine kinase